MDQKPIVLTNYSLVRLLKELLIEMGLSDTKADAVAQIHYQQTNIPQRWSLFLTKNCTSCRARPDTCAYLNPSEEQCSGSATPSEMKSAVAMQIERGSIQACPMKQSTLAPLGSFDET